MVTPLCTFFTLYSSVPWSLLKYYSGGQVLTTFLRGLLLSPHEADYDEILAQRIVAFLVDHHAAILRPPDHLAVLVHRAITTLQRPQVGNQKFTKTGR